MAQIICQSQREGTEWYNLFGSSTKLCYPKVVFQICMLPLSSYFHPVRVPDFQEGRSALTQMLVSIAPAVLNSLVLARAVAAGERGRHHTSMLWLSPCSQFFNRSTKIICQLIWQRLNFQANQQIMYTVHFNWTKLRNGRTGLALHKEVHGSHFGTNSVCKLSCISAMIQEYPNAVYPSPNSSAEQFTHFSRKTYFNHHNW